MRLADGRFFFVYTHVSGGAADHAAARLATRSLDDGGRTWTAEKPALLENEAGINVMSVAPVRLGTGEIAQFYLAKNSLTDCRARRRLSSPGGLVVFPAALHNDQRKSLRRRQLRLSVELGVILQKSPEAGPWVAREDGPAVRA